MDPAPRLGPRLVRCCIGLGSNLGDRVAHLTAAEISLRESPDISGFTLSGIYETSPVGPGPQGPYLNAAACLETSLSARGLLVRLLAVEATRGRRRNGPKHSARSLDLDLLLYGDRCLAEPGLVVPHPELQRRAFVLEPLAEIAGDLVHPVVGERIADLASAVRDPTAVRRVAESLAALPASYSTAI